MRNEEKEPCYKASRLLKIFYVTLLGLICHFNSYGQLYLNAEIRPRSEYRNGYTTLRETSYNPAFFISQRSRLGLDYKKDKLAFRITAQDIRVWGDEEQVKDVPALGVYETWGEVTFNSLFSLRLGRQELSYDDNRILGNLDWQQAGRVHDAAVLRTNYKGWKIDVGAAFNQDKEKFSNTDFPLNNYKALGFVWANKTLFEKLKVSILEVSDGLQSKDSSQKVMFRHTYGADLLATIGKFEIQETFFLQSGKDINNKKIGAFMNAINASYTLKNVKVSIGTDYLSGTDQVGTVPDRNNTFNTLYATNHKFYGFMDYFLNIPKDTKNGGLQDSYFKLKINASSKLSVGVDYHYFALASDLPQPDDNGASIDKYLGSEIDVTFNYKWNDQVGLQGGYSFMQASESMEILKSGTSKLTPQWGWLMLTIKPKIKLAD